MTTIKKKSDKKVSSDAKVSFDTAISTYYKLKGQYNKKVNDKVREIFKSDDSLEEKQKKYKDLKHKCVLCGKTGGTIFSQDSNILTAKCGNLETPCKLDIQLQKADYNNITKSIEIDNKKINLIKNNIITSKLDFLFGFKDQAETLSLFEKLKEDLVKNVKIYQSNTSKYINTIYNIDNQPKINAMESKLNSNINVFKENINNFKTTGETSYLKDAVELYVNTIVALNKELSDNKYKEKKLYIDKDSDIVTLVEKPYKLSDLQIIVPGTENRIIAFSV